MYDAALTAEIIFANMGQYCQDSMSFQIQQDFPKSGHFARTVQYAVFDARKFIWNEKDIQEIV